RLHPGGERGLQPVPRSRGADPSPPARDGGALYRDLPHLGAGAGMGPVGDAAGAGDPALPAALTHPGLKSTPLQLDRLQLVDPLADEVEAALPEGAVGDVDAHLAENDLRPFRAAVGEQLEIAGLEALALLLVAPVERQDQELPEAVGIAIEGRVVDVRNAQPLVAELGRDVHGRRTACAGWPCRDRRAPRSSSRRGSPRAPGARRGRRRPGAGPWHRRRPPPPPGSRGGSAGPALRGATCPSSPSRRTPRRSRRAAARHAG